MGKWKYFFIQFFLFPSKLKLCAKKFKPIPNDWNRGDGRGRRKDTWPDLGVGKGLYKL